MSDFLGEETLNEQRYIQELKKAAGIGLLGVIEGEEEDEESGLKEELNNVSNNETNMKKSNSSDQDSGHRPQSIKELLEVYRKPDSWLENKAYSRLLLPDEFTVKESYVWKRHGWSFKYRCLVLTNKPRLFYTTKDGHYKGMVPWSMTEPIEIEMIDRTHFDISIHSSSRIYHFNDKISGAEEWVRIINEISECWKQYLTENAPEKKNKRRNNRGPALVR